MRENVSSFCNVLHCLTRAVTLIHEHYYDLYSNKDLYVTDLRRLVE